MKAYQAVVVALAGAACISAAPAYDWGLPRGVTPPNAPADNPMSKSKVELGRRLFYEAALSSDYSLSCGSCHRQDRGFSEDKALHRGVDGSMGKRNPMGLTNIGYVSPLTWADPKLMSLEDQAMNPIFGDQPVEMGMHGREADIIARLSADGCYPKQFRAAFPEDGGAITIKNVTKAIAAFERTLLSFDSPYDRYERGEQLQLSERAIRGAYLFDHKECGTCHGGRDFSDNGFHDIGLPSAERDRGVVEKTGRKGDENVFRTTTLRNIALTGPYMHDGSVETLSGAIMAHKIGIDGRLSPPVSEDEAADMVAFMESLTDPNFIAGGNFEAPPSRCEANG